MPATLSHEGLIAMLALIGAVIIVAALLSGIVERSNFPQVAAFLLMGALLGPAVAGRLNVGLDSPILRVVATISLALVLFTDAITISLAEIRREAKLAGAILGPGTILAAAAVGFAGHRLLGLQAAHAAILGAALASTDPVILRALLRRPDIPGSARLSLRLESALNDVVLLPIILVAMAFLTRAPGDGEVSVPAIMLRMLVLGPGAGAAVALICIGAMVVIRRRFPIRRDYESFYSIGVCFAAFAAAEALHSSGFLAAFAAGLTIAAFDINMCDCFREYGETTAEMLLLFTFVLLGASLIWTGFEGVNPALVGFGVVALCARPLSLVATLTPMKVEPRSRRLIAWFGPRGLSTLLLVLVPIFAGTPGTPPLFKTAAFVVILSVVIHGGSIMLLDRRARKVQPGEDPLPIVRTIEDMERLRGEGIDVRLIDVRSRTAFQNSKVLLADSTRLDPDFPAKDLNLPKDSWPALFCT